MLSIACSFVQVQLFWLLDQCLDSIPLRFSQIIKFRYRQACDLRVGRFLGSIIYSFAVLLHLVLFIFSHFIFRIFPTTLCTKFVSNFERRNVIFRTFATKEMKSTNSTWRFQIVFSQFKGFQPFFSYFKEVLWHMMQIFGIFTTQLILFTFSGSINMAS